MLLVPTDSIMEMSTHYTQYVHNNIMYLSTAFYAYITQ